MRGSRLSHLAILFFAMGFGQIAMHSVNASPLDTIEITPYGDVNDEDLAAIDALATEYIGLVQNDSVMAAMLMITDTPIVLDQIRTFSQLVSEQCPYWDSISLGESKVLTRDVYQRDYYLISNECVFRLRLHFGRTNAQWRIVSAVFLNPQALH